MSQRKGTSAGGKVKVLLPIPYVCCKASQRPLGPPRGPLPCSRESHHIATPGPAAAEKPTADASLEGRGASPKVPIFKPLGRLGIRGDMKSSEFPRSSSWVVWCFDTEWK